MNEKQIIINALNELKRQMDQSAIVPSDLVDRYLNLVTCLTKLIEKEISHV